MSQPPLEEDPFVSQVRRQSARMARGRHLTFWQGLGLAGAVGWMVSGPAVVGALIGHWLDRLLGSGVLWSLALLAIGLVLGCASAWRHVHREIWG